VNGGAAGGGGAGCINSTIVSRTASMVRSVSLKLVNEKNDFFSIGPELKLNRLSIAAVALLADRPADLVRRGVRRALSLSALHAACSSAARSNGESLVSVSSAPLELANTTAYISVSSTTPTLVAAAHVSSKKAERNPACARPCAPTHNMRRD